MYIHTPPWTWRIHVYTYTCEYIYIHICIYIYIYIYTYDFISLFIYTHTPPGTWWKSWHIKCLIYLYFATVNVKCNILENVPLDACCSALHSVAHCNTHPKCNILHVSSRTATCIQCPLRTHSVIRRHSISALQHASIESKEYFTPMGQECFTRMGEECFTPMGIWTHWMRVAVR